MNVKVTESMRGDDLCPDCVGINVLVTSVLHHSTQAMPMNSTNQRNLLVFRQDRVPAFVLEDKAQLCWWWMWM